MYDTVSPILYICRVVKFFWMLVQFVPFTVTFYKLCQHAEGLQLEQKTCSDVMKFYEKSI